MMRPFSFISIVTPFGCNDIAPLFPYPYNYRQADHQSNNVYPTYSRPNQVAIFKAGFMPSSLYLNSPKTKVEGGQYKVPNHQKLTD